jgi:hypothetical protein
LLGLRLVFLVVGLPIDFLICCVKIRHFGDILNSAIATEQDLYRIKVNGPQFDTMICDYALEMRDYSLKE